MYLGGGFIRGIVGMHQDESDALLRVSPSHTGDAEFVWLALAFRRRRDWDERSTDHHAAGGPFVGRREMRRIECSGTCGLHPPDAPARPRTLVTPSVSG